MSDWFSIGCRTGIWVGRTCCLYLGASVPVHAEGVYRFSMNWSTVHKVNGLGLFSSCPDVAEPSPVLFRSLAHKRAASGHPALYTPTCVVCRMLRSDHDNGKYRSMLELWRFLAKIDEGLVCCVMQVVVGKGWGRREMYGLLGL